MNRAKRRFPVRAPVQVSWLDRHGNERHATGTVIDVSECGARVRLSEPVGASIARVNAKQLDIRDLDADVRYCNLRQAKAG